MTEHHFDKWDIWDWLEMKFQDFCVMARLQDRNFVWSQEDRIKYGIVKQAIEKYYKVRVWSRLIQKLKRNKGESR